MKIKYGDIIGVPRLGGIFDHYGVFENEERVYEYAPIGEGFGKAIIHTSALKEFLRGSEELFVLSFPEKYGKPEKHEATMSKESSKSVREAFSVLSAEQRASEYHIYTPEETIMRAKSKLGEARYSLLFNNCEHYAIWCKTGVHQSHQVEDILRLSLKIKAASLNS